jgi:hypothetical protein
MRFLVLMILGFVLESCQSAPKSTAPVDLTPEAYVISDQATLTPPVQITDREVREDIRFLIGALERGYSGYKYVPNGQTPKALSELKKIQSVANPVMLKNQIDEILFQIPDNHLRATLNWEASPIRKSQEKMGRVGKNILADSKKFWSAGIHYDWGKKPVLLIGLKRFPSRKDPDWQGFLPSVKGFLKDSGLIILDLRGNGGGDDKMGISLAQLLTGDGFRYPVSRQVELNTPEAKAIFWNSIKLRILTTRLDGKEVPDHFWALYKERKMEFDEANYGGQPAEKVHSFLEQEYSSMDEASYKKPIYILMDGECASSCESTLDGFEYQKNVTRVGESSGGFIHFGNIGNILLPHSQIVIQIPTHYYEYADLRFIERTGIQPDLPVPEGKDALEFLRDKLKLRK